MLTVTQKRQVQRELASQRRRRCWYRLMRQREEEPNEVELEETNELFLLPLETRDATETVTVSETLVSPDKERLDEDAKGRNTKEELDGMLTARVYRPKCT